MRLAPSLSCAAFVSSSTLLPSAWMVSMPPSPPTCKAAAALTKSGDAVHCCHFDCSRVAHVGHSDLGHRRTTVRSRPSTTMLAATRQPHGDGREGGENTEYVDSGNVPALMARGGSVALKKRSPGIYSRITGFVNKRFFLIGAVLAVSAARLNPAIGATGGLLRPELTVNKGAIPIVFFLVGLTIQLGELAGAALNVRLNLLTQFFSLGIMPTAGWALSRVLRTGGMHPSLADGVMILMTLPTTVNMCVILTQTAEGNTAAAAFNAVLGNLLGVVVTPALLLLLVGRRLDMAPSLLGAFKKLGIKVVLPLALGQLARYTPVRTLHERLPKAISRLSECILLTVIYTTFCDTFLNAACVTSPGAGVVGGGGGGGVLVLLGILPLVHLLSIGCLDALSRLPFMKLTERDRIAVMFCGGHKTLAFGIPLIKALFEGNSSIGMLSTPLLLYHPAQLMLGTAIAPVLRARAEARTAAASQKSG